MWSMVADVQGYCGMMTKKHPEIEQSVSFTGSSKVGKIIASKAVTKIVLN